MREFDTKSEYKMSSSFFETW